MHYWRQWLDINYVFYTVVGDIMLLKAVLFLFVERCFKNLVMLLMESTNFPERSLSI